MKISKANPFIQDPVERDRAVTRLVVISSRIEGVDIDADKLSSTLNILVNRYSKKMP